MDRNEDYNSKTRKKTNPELEDRFEAAEDSGNTMKETKNWIFRS